MSTATMQGSEGKVVSIQTGCVLDLSAFETILSASDLANTPETSSIEVDLGKTLHIRDSGVAMLQLLRKLTRWTCPIRLVNLDPVVHYRITTSRIGTQFQFAVH